MGSNWINLGLRFLLELGGLAALAWAGWSQGSGAWPYVFAVAFPVVAASVWGIFAVPNDPSRSGEAVVPIPGIARILLELIFFAAAAMALFFTGATALAWIYGAVVIAHYAASYDRLCWLIRQ